MPSISASSSPPRVSIAQPGAHPAQVGQRAGPRDPPGAFHVQRAGEGEAVCEQNLEEGLLAPDPLEVGAGPRDPVAGPDPLVHPVPGEHDRGRVEANSPASLLDRPAGARRVPELLPALERDRGPDRSQAALSGLPAEHDRVLRGDPVLGQRHHEGRVPALRNGAVDSVPERRAPEVARHPEQALPRGVGNDDDVGVPGEAGLVHYGDRCGHRPKLTVRARRP